MKLEYKNNWQHDEYYVAGKRVINLQVVEIGKQEFPVKSKLVTISTQENGKTYYSVTKRFYIEGDLLSESGEPLGIKQELDLSSIISNIDVAAVKYDVKYEN